VPIKGKLFVISGPSGVGKDTLAGEVIRTQPGLKRVVTATTRPPRKGEVNGTNYWFLSADEFDQRISSNGFLEWATVHGNRYGTPRKEIEDSLRAGMNLLLAIDVQGAKTIKDKMREAVTIFIAPPSFKELEKRLRGRSTENEREIAARIKTAETEIEHLDAYDYAVVNAEIRDAAADLRGIITTVLDG